MSSSYTKNIERLKANQRQISAQEQNITTAAAKEKGDWMIREARDIANKLTPFSTALQEWKEKDIEKKKEEGRLEAVKARLDKAKWINDNGSPAAQKLYAIEQARKMGELAFEFEDAAAQDKAYLDLKEQVLNEKGTIAYPEADRITKLSPWRQVGFAQEQIRYKMLAFPEQLAHSLQNGKEPINLGGITYTAEEIRDNNLAFPMKEAAIEYYSDQIFKNLGLDKYSEEMLRMSKVHDIIQKSKDSQLSKYRKRYNIEASQNTQKEAKLEWDRSEKTAADLEKLLKQYSNTTDTKGNLLHKAGGWQAVESILINEGVQKGGTWAHAETILSLPMTDSMCRELGVPLGTTFLKQWPDRLTRIRTGIKKGFKAQADAEKDFLEAKITDLGNKFQERAQTGEIDGKELEWWEQQSWEVGGALDSRIKNYKTLSERNEERDIERIEDLKGSNNGTITHTELNQFHPRAASKYREEATRHENAFKKIHRVDESIKAALNNSWTEAGLKSKEKPLIWQQALARATKDYYEKFNRLVAMGIDPDQASQLAMNASLGEVKHPETKEPIPDFQGVVNEIKTNGAGSKYTVKSQGDIDDFEDSMIRMHEIDVGKKQMLENPDPRTFLIGHDYGKDRLNEIIENMKWYGPWEGIIQSDQALKYYQGLARGKRGWNAHSLIDAQLKAAGHPGLFPDRKEKEVKEEDDGSTEQASNIIEESKEGGSLVSYNNLITNTNELQNMRTGQPSDWNRTENTAGYLA